MKNKLSTPALGGICTAIGLILLFFGTVIPRMSITFFSLASFTTAVMIVQSGISGGILAYIATTVLAFIMLPNKIALLPFAFFFGYYGILKYLIEKLHSLILQLLLKGLIFFSVLYAGIFIFRKLLAASFSLPDHSRALLLIAGIALLFLYDFIYTNVIGFYMERILNRGLRNKKLS